MTEEGPSPPGGRRDDDRGSSRFDLAVETVRELLSGAAVVVAIGLVLFAVSGVWPPMVAVESGSMDPHMQKGDLIFVLEPGRLAPDAAREPGVVSREVGTEQEYRKFEGYGDVIIFRPGGRDGVPIIHRAHFWVEEGENWYDRADERYLFGDSCAEIVNCPAPNDGFITKGDANPLYDQNRMYRPVKSEWVVGKASVRVPWLGWVRLAVSGNV